MASSATPPLQPQFDPASGPRGVRLPYPQARLTAPARARNPSKWIFLPAVLMIYAAIVPPEIRVSIADQTLYVPRIVGFALFPWLVLQSFRNPIRFVIWDALIVLASLWMLLSFMVIYGPAEGVLRGTALALDLLLPYFIGRYSIRSLADFRRVLVFAAPVLPLAGLAMATEAFSGQVIVRPFFAEIFGRLPRYEGGVAVGTGKYFVDHRLGLLRANGPFSHPILAGLFMASFLPLFFFSGLRKWPFFVGIGASFFAFFSGSSAAYLSLMVSIGLIAFDLVQRRVSFLSWQIFIPSAAMVLAILQTLSSDGLVSFAMRSSLNPRTAFYRRFIWEHGTESVRNHPWFGIGFQEFERLSWMTSSVDHHWLMFAMRFGLIPAILLLLVAVAAMVLLSRAAGRQSQSDRSLFIGVAIAIFGFVLLGCTVAFFGGVQAWVYMLIGMAISLATMAKGAAMRAPHRAGSAHGPDGRPVGNGTPMSAPTSPYQSARSRPLQPRPVHPAVRAQLRQQVVRDNSSRSRS